MSEFPRTLSDFREGYRSKSYSAAEITAQTLEGIEQRNPELNAFLFWDRETAIAQAKDLDARGPDDRPLWGIPVAIKDVISTQGMPTTAASRILEGYVPAYDATVVKKLKDAGAIIVGKTNCDEFAMGGSGENSAYGPTKNPKDPARVPGGSSSGSAAAVAAGLVPIALGTDTGGSIREPASFCGIVGLKPTYGRVSRYGLLSLASSFDQIGPFATCVEDAAAVFDVLAGHDPLDSTSYPDAPQPTLPSLNQSVKGMTVGVPKEYLPDTLPPEIRASVEAAMDQCRSLGMTVKEVSLPHILSSLAAYYIILPCEASSNLARYDGIRFGRGRECFGSEVKRRILIGTYALSAGYVDAYYKRAQKVRTLIKQDFDRAFKDVDLLIGPVTPSTAFRLGALTDPLALYLMDIFTVGVNVAGLPALSIPYGEHEGLPIGLHIIGRPSDETRCLQLAANLGQKRGDRV